MELHEARSRVQTMLNFFKGLQKLEEVFVIAETAEQLQKERAAACEEVGRKLELANTNFEAEAKRHRDTLTEIKQQVAYAQGKQKELLKVMGDELAAAEASKVAAIAVARTKQAEAENECQAAISFMESRKAELEKQVKSLESSLEKLKAKVGAL